MPLGWASLCNNEDMVNLWVSNFVSLGVERGRNADGAGQRAAARSLECSSCVERDGSSPRSGLGEAGEASP